MFFLPNTIKRFLDSNSNIFIKLFILLLLTSNILLAQNYSYSEESTIYQSQLNYAGFTNVNCINKDNRITAELENQIFRNDAEALKK